ncbi:MAG: DegT/DnrJ/EryC1/StrS family aminotransferase [Jatrophihabitantaceae bacterium]
MSEKLMDVPFVDLRDVTGAVRSQVSDAWSALLDSTRFIGGEAVDRFESQWAAYCGASEAVGVGNGTDAIHLTLRAMGIGAGDEVVVPANSFVATAEGVVLAGATPRFADVDPATLLLSADCLEAAVTSRTKAVIVVHLYGQMADMDAVCAAAHRAGIAVIEDAAQAHGATWRGRTAGSIGDVGCFSFYPGKNLGAFGDAGAVVTSDSALAARLRAMRDHGRSDGSHYQHAYIGTNSRLDAVQAVVLSAKLAHLAQWNEARRAIAQRYRTALAESSLDLVAEAPGSCGVYHLAVVQSPQRDRMRRWLADRGVQSAVHYPTPIHQLAAYQYLGAQPSLPVAERAADRVLSLPMFPHMTQPQIAQVCAALAATDELVLTREALHA